MSDDLYQTLRAILTREVEALPAALPATIPEDALTPAQRMELLVLYWPWLDAAFDGQHNLVQTRLWSVFFAMPEDAQPPLACSADLADRALAQIIAHHIPPSTRSDDARRRDLVWLDQRISQVLENLTEPLSTNGQALVRQALPHMRTDAETRFYICSDAGLEDEAAASWQSALDKATPLRRREMECLAEAAPELRATAIGLIVADTDALITRLPAYAALCKTILDETAGHLRDIHEGRAPFVADKALAYDDARVIERIARVGLLRGTEWINAAIPQIWCDAAHAPAAKTKTMPSQTLVLGLGRAAADVATAQSFLWLEEVRALVRHAGAAKKLEKYRKEALANISRAPDLALQWPASEPVPKKLLTPLRKSVESLLASSKWIDAAEWNARFTAADGLAALTTKLLWQAQGVDTPLTWMPEGWSDPTVTPTALRLWHPVEASEQARASLRAEAAAEKRTQPFAQIYREVYTLPPEEAEGREMHSFAGYTVATDPMGAAGQSTGWTADDHKGMYVKTLMGHRFGLVVGGRLYPGSGSYNAQTGPLRLLDGAARLADVPARLISEILRDVDLLTVLGINGLPQEAPEDYAPFAPGNRKLAMRVETVERLFAEALASGQLQIKGRQAQIGPYQVHLLTGRVLENGAEVTLKPATRIWLPFEDATLSRIIRSIAALLKASA